MSKNLQEVLTNLQIEKTRAESKFVFYIPETGHITKITNTPEDLPGHQTLRVNIDDVEDILTGKKRQEDFSVTYNSREKKLGLKEFSLENNFISISDKLYKIPTNLPEPDICIFRWLGRWTIHMGKNTKDEQKRLLHILDNLRFSFSITSKNDPNILYGHFSIKYHDLILEDHLDISNQLPQYIPNDVSIYTSRYFEKYSFETHNE